MEGMWVIGLASFWGPILAVLISLPILIRLIWLLIRLLRFLLHMPRPKPGVPWRWGYRLGTCPSCGVETSVPKRDDLRDGTTCHECWTPLSW